MAKKKITKILFGVGTAAVAGKVAYNKYKQVKEKFAREEDESVAAEIRKYNAVFDKKIVEVEDEPFNGCEIKTIGSKTVVDLGLASFEKDVYINFSSTLSTISIILPEGVNAACDVERTFSGVRNLVDNIDDEDVHTVYIIGKAVLSNVEVIPVNFYVDDDLAESEAAEETEKTEETKEAENTEEIKETEGTKEAEKTEETKEEEKTEEKSDGSAPEAENGRKGDDELDIKEVEVQ